MCTRGGNVEKRFVQLRDCHRGVHSNRMEPTFRRFSRGQCFDVANAARYASHTLNHVRKATAKPRVGTAE